MRDVPVFLTFPSSVRLNEVDNIKCVEPTLCLYIYVL